MKHYNTKGNHWRSCLIWYNRDFDTYR